MTSDTSPYIEISMGGFGSSQGQFTLRLHLRNIGLGPASIQSTTLAGEELAIPKRGLAAGEGFKTEVVVTGKRITKEKVEDPKIVVEYTDVEGQNHISEAVVEQKHGADNLYRIESIHSTKKQIQGIQPKTIITRGALRVFVSHSHHDRVQATVIKQVFEMYGMEVFVAHEDLAPSVQWEQEIHTFLQTADLFISILTDNFRESLWTDQEAGIAYERGMEFFPIIVDRIPYGFLGKYHGMKCAGGVNRELAKGMVDELLKNERISLRILDSLIRALNGSMSFDQANSIIVRITNYDGHLDAKKVNAICQAWLNNSQVRDAFKARDLVSDFLRNRKEDIDPSLLNDLYSTYQQ